MYWPQTHWQLARTINGFREEGTISDHWHSFLEFHWPCSSVFVKKTHAGSSRWDGSRVSAHSAMSSLCYRMTFIDEASEPLAPVNKRAKSCPPVMHHKIGFDQCFYFQLFNFFCFFYLFHWCSQLCNGVRFAEPRKEAVITKHMSNLCRFQHEDKLLTLQAQHPKRLHIQIFHSSRNGIIQRAGAWPRCRRYRKGRSCCFEVLSQTRRAQACNSRRGTVAVR